MNCRFQRAWVYVTNNMSVLLCWRCRGGWDDNNSGIFHGKRFQGPWDLFTRDPKTEPWGTPVYLSGQIASPCDLVLSQITFEPGKYGLWNTQLTVCGGPAPCGGLLCFNRGENLEIRSLRLFWVRRRGIKLATIYSEMDTPCLSERARLRIFAIFPQTNPLVNF